MKNKPSPPVDSLKDCSSGENSAPWWLPGGSQEAAAAGGQQRRQSLLETVSGKLSKLRSLRRGSVPPAPADTNEVDEDDLPSPPPPNNHKTLMQHQQRRSSCAAVVDTDTDDTPAKRPPLNLVRRASNLFGGGECVTEGPLPRPPDVTLLCFAECVLSSPMF